MPRFMLSYPMIHIVVSNPCSFDPSICCHDLLVLCPTEQTAVSSASRAEELPSFKQLVYPQLKWHNLQTYLTVYEAVLLRVMLSECGTLLRRALSLKLPTIECAYSDASDAAWDEWYGFAKQFAQGSLPGGAEAIAAMTADFLKTLLLAWPGAPDRCLLDRAKQVLHIFATKPKFAAILSGEHGEDARGALVRALADPVATRAHGLALDTSLASERRRGALGLLSSAIAAGRVACSAAGSALGSAALPFNLSVQALAASACSPSADMLHRDAALSCLRNAAGENGHGRAPVVAAALLKSARDSESFAAAFNMGALQQQVCVAAVAARVQQSRASAKASDAATSLSESVRKARRGSVEPAPNTQFVSDVLAGLYQAMADARSVSRTGQAAESAEAWSVLASSAEHGVVTLLAACDVVNHAEAATVALLPEGSQVGRSPLQQAASMYCRAVAPRGHDGGVHTGSPTEVQVETRHVANPGADAAACPCVWDEGAADGRGGVRIQAASSRTLQTMCEDDDWERPQEWLDMCRALIEERPESVGVVRLMLAHPTENTLSTLNSIGETLGEPVWHNVVLPFVRTRLRLMGEAVSGSQFEQDSVLLLREATRVWFTNDDPNKRPSSAFQSSMWHSMLLAMKHGYSETERFPEIASRLLRHCAGVVNAGDESVDGHGLLRDWVLAAVSPQMVGRSHKMYRSIAEVLFVALGMESSAFGTEEAVSVVEIPEPAVATILTALATADTPASRFIWHELCFSYSAFLMAHKGALALLLQSLSRKVNATVNDRLRQAGLALQPEVALPSSKSGPTKLAVMSDVDLQASLDLLAELALVVAPSHALLVLGTALKIMSLLPASVEAAHMQQDGKRSRTVKTGDAAVDEGASLRAGSGYATDESLAAVIEKIPSVHSLPRGMVEEALTLCGVQSRSALGRLIPTPCLADASPLVRKSALQALATGRGSIRDALLTAQTQVRVMQSVRPDAPDADMGLWAVAELAAALPFPASLSSLQAMRNNDNIQGEDSSGAYAAAETATATGAGAVAFREHDSASSAAGTHTITATVAPVTDLKTYDLHLLLAAAPVLAATAVAASADVIDITSPSMSQAVAVLSAALGRLLRGAQLSVEATELSDTHPDFVRALSKIASGVPACVLEEYARSPAACHRLGTLAKLAPEWYSLLHSWTASGILSRRMLGGYAAQHASGISMVPPSSTFRALDERWASPAARFALGLPPVGTTPATLQAGEVRPSAPAAEREDDPEASELLHGASFSSAHGSEPTAVLPLGGNASVPSLHDAFTEAVHREQWLLAVRIAGQILRSPPQKHKAIRDKVQGLVRESVLPAIKASSFPKPDAMGSFAPSDIERYDELQGLRNELMGELGVGIVQDTMQLNQLLEDMERAAVVQRASAGRIKEARDWMLSHGVRNPSLSLYVDALERQAAQPAKSQGSLYPSFAASAPAAAATSSGQGVNLLGAGYDDIPLDAETEEANSEQVWVQLSTMRSQPKAAAGSRPAAVSTPRQAAAPPAATAPAAVAAQPSTPHMAAAESADASFDLFAQLPDAPLHRVAMDPVQSRSAAAASGAVLAGHK